MPYISALYCAAISSLADGRDQLSRKFIKSILEPSSCLFTLLPNPQDPSVTTRLRSANNSHASPAVRENIRHSFPMLSLSINLHNYPNIYLSILFLLLQFSMTVSIYLLYTVLWFIRTVFLHVLNMLFGFMTTRLNKCYTEHVIYHWRYTYNTCVSIFRVKLDSNILHSSAYGRRIWKGDAVFIV